MTLDPQMFTDNLIVNRPPVRLLHSVKSIICYEEEGPVCYEGEGPQIYITIEFSLSVTNLRNRVVLYGSWYLYLLYPLMILSGNSLIRVFAVCLKGS